MTYDRHYSLIGRSAVSGMSGHPVAVSTWRSDGRRPTVGLRGLWNDSAVSNAQELRNHLAYEVHWLVHAAVRFKRVRGRDRVAFQDSAFIHARNLLEFTGPGRPKHGWWIQNLGGAAPPADALWKAWSALINSNVTHLGSGRLKLQPWPVPYDDVRCIEMSRYFLTRLCTAARGSADQRMTIAGEIAALGLTYIDRQTPAALRKLADMVGG